MRTLVALAGLVVLLASGWAAIAAIVLLVLGEPAALWWAAGSGLGVAVGCGLADTAARAGERRAARERTDRLRTGCILAQLDTEEST